MANKKITELNAASSLAATDVVPVVDVSADETKKITATDLFRTLPDGTAAAPALAFSSDQANGVYLAGTDTVGISTGGTQRVTVDGSGNVTISGDLTVSGATTTVESTTVTIDDKNIELGSVASPSNTTADGGGITLKGATDKTLKWINSTDSWTFNQSLHVDYASNDPAVFTIENNEGSFKLSANANLGLLDAAQHVFRNAAGSSEYARIDSSGRLGIGTASPNQTLKVVKSSSGGTVIEFTDNTNATGRLGTPSSQVVAFGGNTNHSIAFGGYSTDGSTFSDERMRINSSGNVGIGTASPSNLLHVNGQARFEDFLRGHSTQNKLYIADDIALSATKKLYLDGGSNTYIHETSADNIAVVTSGSERLRIDSSGRVGIGTSSPTVELDVTGDARLRSTSTSDGPILQFDGAGPNGTNYTFGKIEADNTGSNNTGELRFYTNLASAGGLAQRMVIARDGKVGIGTTSPTEKLDIQGTGDVKAAIQTTSTGSGANAALRLKTGAYNWLLQTGDTVNGGIRFYDSTNNSERVRIDSSGRLLIGTTSSNGKFYNSTSVNHGLQIETTTAYGQSWMSHGTSANLGAHLTIGRSRGTSAGSVTVVQDGDNLGQLSFQGADGTECVEAAQIKALVNGTPGANDMPGALTFSTNSGTTSPTERLRITSTGAWGIEGASNYGTSGQVLTSNGNDSPTWQDASGGGASAIDDLSDAVTNSSGATIGLGTGALANDDGSANSNTAVGKNALYANTSGSHNAAVGKDAGVNITTGQKNVVVGSEALYTNTTGDQNVSIGYNSLFSNTTASNNTAAGHNALFANTTGTKNAAVGAFTLDANTTGNSNSAVGYNVLGANTTGSNNVAMGDGALTSNTTASNNTAIGNSALIVNTTGTNNVAIGSATLDANTTASGNTGVGRAALSSNTTGASNTGIGYAALINNTTASSNTAVGSNALEANTTGTRNTATGVECMDQNTTGSYNTAYGFQALEKNTTANDNAAFGYQSLEENTTGTQNTAVGRNALTANTTANDNTAVGYLALSSNQTGASNTFVGSEAGKDNTANSNTGIGKRALYENTSGHSNTAVGKDALYNSTTGSNNVAIGTDCMEANTTGYENVAIGQGALIANTTGARNTALGRNALDACVTGGTNVALGYNALSNYTQNNNVAIGGDAAKSTQTGGQNTVVGDAAARDGNGYIHCTLIGAEAGKSNSAHEITAVGYRALMSNTGGDNTAVGYQALDANTSGYNNTAVGFGAGGANTSAAGNTFVGKNAGGNNTTGGSNICIGVETGTLNGAGSNQIVLGYNIDSVGSNYFTFGKPSNRVYNNFSSNASWTRSSDVRLKKDIQTNTDLGLGFINDLRTVTYKWKAPSELDSALPGYNADKTEAEYTNKMYGFIAQEVKQALDDHNVTDFAGWTTDNEGVQGISYEMFVMPLVKAVQELSAENVALKARLDAAGI